MERLERLVRFVKDVWILAKNPDQSLSQLIETHNQWWEQRLKDEEVKRQERYALEHTQRVEREAFEKYEMNRRLREYQEFLEEAKKDQVIVPEEVERDFHHKVAEKYKNLLKTQKEMESVIRGRSEKAQAIHLSGCC